MMPTQLEHCITCDTAHEMWTKVILIHEQKSSSNKASLLQKFYACRMEPSETIVQFITKVLNMVRTLEELEEKISELGITSKILGSLPTKFNNFVTAWDSINAKDQTLANLQERLIKEEKGISENEEETSAFIATKYNVPGKQKSDERSSRPHDKAQGHKISTSVICYYSKRPGHFARDCRKRKRAAHKGKLTSEDSPTAFIALASENQVSTDGAVIQREVANAS